MTPTDQPRWLIGRSHASLSDGTCRQPLLTRDCKNKRGKTTMDCFLFHFHCVFLGKAAVCSREKTPNEKRMKSTFAISSARRPTSSSPNGRRINRGVSRTAMELMKTKNARLSIHNRRCQQTGRNMRGRPHRQI